MNSEHYTRVAKVLAQSATVLGHRLKGEGRQSYGAAVSQGCQVCADIWESEFPEAEGLGTKVPLDLSGADFTGAIFAQMMGSTVRLNNANFSTAQLDQTRWLFVHVKHANFDGASLRGAFMLGVCCEGASFRRADLSGADIDIVIGERNPAADLTGADLTGARVKINGATPLVLTGAKMTGCHVACYTTSTQPADLKCAENARRQFLAALSEEQRAQVVLEDAPPTETGESGQCFIAAAACGDANAWEVVALREFRDRMLTRNAMGRLFVQAYYVFSPPLAKVISHSPLLRVAARTALIRPLARSAQRLVQRARPNGRG